MLPTVRANLVNELIGDLNRHVEDVWDTMSQLARLTRDDDEDDIEENLDVMDAVDSLSFFSRNGWSTYFVDEPERDEPALFTPPRSGPPSSPPNIKKQRKAKYQRRIVPINESDPTGPVMGIIEPVPLAPVKRPRAKRRIKPYHESDPEWLKANDEAAANALLDALSDAVSPAESSRICEDFSTGKRTYERPPRRNRKAPKKYN